MRRAATPEPKCLHLPAAIFCSGTWNSSIHKTRAMPSPGCDQQSRGSCRRSLCSTGTIPSARKNHLDDAGQPLRHINETPLRPGNIFEEKGHEAHDEGGGSKFAVCELQRLVPRGSGLTTSTSHCRCRRSRTCREIGEKVGRGCRSCHTGDIRL